MKKQITEKMQKLKYKRKTNPFSYPPINFHYQFPPQDGEETVGHN